MEEKLKSPLFFSIKSLSQPKIDWLVIFSIFGLGFFFLLPVSYIKMLALPWVLLWQLAFLSANAYLIWALRRFDVPFRRLGYGLDWVVVAFSGVIIVSPLVAPFPKLAAWYVPMVLGYIAFLYALVSWVSNGNGRLQKLWLTSIVFGIGTNIVSLTMWRPRAEMWTSDDFFDAIRNPWPLGHHNFMGGFEVLIFPLAVTYALAMTGWKRWTGALASLLALFNIYASGSRGALLGAFVILICFAASALLRSKGKQRYYAVLGGVAVIAGLFALTLTNPRIRTVVSKVNQSLEQGDNLFAGLLKDGPITDRWMMLKALGNILKDRPVFGVGVGNMSRVYNLYRPIEAGDGLDHVQQLHNTPAQFLGELGLLGFVVYVACLICLGVLAFKLARHLQERQDRWLLTGVIVSILGYLFSSLTDYQLENIPITTILVLNVVFIVCLAQQKQLPPKAIDITSKNIRRSLSLVVFAVFGLSLSIWIPANLANYTGVMAKRVFLNDQVVKADQYWDTASRIQTWDPVFNIIAGNHLLKLSTLVDAEDQENLQTQAVKYFSRALDAAPNDSVLNFILATQVLEKDPAKAEIYASRSVQLLPRVDYYTYHVLGLAYLAQGKTDQATSAFALGIMNFPKSLGLTNWQEPPLAELKSAVIEKTAHLYDELLQNLDTTSPAGMELYEQNLVFRWWSNLPIPDYDSSKLYPLVQALLIAQESPEQAVNIVDQAIEAYQEDPDRVLIGNRETPNRGLALLKLWLKPELLSQEEQAEQFGLPPEGMAEVREHILQHRDIRSWLTSIAKDAETFRRSGLFFMYRNPYANSAIVGTVPRPEGLSIYAIPEVIELFSDTPRDCYPLDQVMNKYRSQWLGLPHPTETGFQLTTQLDT